MSFIDKEFCFTCKLDADQLEKVGKKLLNCAVCKIAQYCGEDCARLDYALNHKFICKGMYQQTFMGYLENKKNIPLKI